MQMSAVKMGVAISPFPFVIAHKAGCARAPENTVPAIIQAARDGAKAIEIDVHLTKDGVPVLSHDSNLRRCTNGVGEIADKTFAEIGMLSAGFWFSDKFAATDMPTLKAALSASEMLELAVNIELKPTQGNQHDLVEAVADVVVATGRLQAENVLVSSFSDEALSEARKAMPYIPRALIAPAAPLLMVERLAAVGATAIHLPEAAISAEQVATAHDNGIAVRAYVVNDADVARELIAAGVDGIFTDDPGHILSEVQ